MVSQLSRIQLSISKAMLVWTVCQVGASLTFLYQREYQLYEGALKMAGKERASSLEVRKH